MRILPPALLALTICSLPVLAAEGAGKAEWLTAATQVRPGHVLQTAVKLTLEPGWHVYWINPGDAGMPTTVKWTTEKGVTCGSLQHLWPKCFSTGGLKGYGYEGEAWYPVTVTVPEDFTGKAVLSGELNWLACNDEACVAGSAVIALTLEAGEPVAGPDAEAVAKAHAKVAQPAGKAIQLKVTDAEDHWQLEVVGEDKGQLHGARALVATPQMVAAGDFIQFEEIGPRTMVTVPKSEYAPEKVQELELWFLQEKSETPRILTWKAKP